MSDEPGGPNHGLAASGVSFGNVIKDPLDAVFEGRIYFNWTYSLPEFLDFCHFLGLDHCVFM